MAMTFAQLSDPGSLREISLGLAAASRRMLPRPRIGGIGEPLRGSVPFWRLTPGSGEGRAATGGYTRQPLTGLALGRGFGRRGPVCC